jgi:hypothetical protein
MLRILQMRDLEFILRFFALDSEKIKNTEKGTISLKKYLNEYMGSEESEKKEVLKLRKETFEFVIDFIFEFFGENAFFNVQATDLTTIRKRFYPTIFDSLTVATAIALRNGFKSTTNLEPLRLQLLKDENYRDSITQGTMKIEHIHGRISKALEDIYKMRY